MEQLVLSIMGENHPNLAFELTKIINQCDCNIIDAQINTMGSEFVGNLLLAGSWSTFAKLETHVAHLEKKFAIHVLTKRTKPREYKQAFLPYMAYIIGKDQAGVLNQIIGFFDEQSIEIRELYSETFVARQTGIVMAALSLSVNIPADKILSELRERFILFCDQYNLDGIMEVEKN